MVIKFDIPAIPVGVTVTRADLSLYCYQDDYPATGVLFDLFRLTRPWVETEVTWYQSDADSIWDNAGGDFYPAYIDQKQMDMDVTGTWQTFNAAAAIQKFVNEPDSNFGLLISREIGSDDLYFYTSEAPDDSLRPRLTVSYTTDTNSIADAWKLPAGFKGEVLVPVEGADGISFSVRLPEGKGYKLAVYDVTGRKTWSYTGFSSEGKAIWSFSGSPVKSGVFLAILTSENLQVRKSFIIQQ